MPAKPPRPASIDPSVADLLGNSQRRERERSMPVQDRRKLIKQRQKEAKRNRFNADLTPAVVDRIKGLASDIGCPASDVTEALLRYGLAAIDAGDLDLADHPHKPSRSPRYEIVLEFVESPHGAIKRHPNKRNP